MILKLLRYAHSMIRILRRGIVDQTSRQSRGRSYYVICTVDDERQVKFYVDDDQYTNDPRDAQLLTSLDDASYTATLCAARQALVMWRSMDDGRPQPEQSTGIPRHGMDYVAMQASHWVEEVIDVDAFRSSNALK
jgi:hypothetical protein